MKGTVGSVSAWERVGTWDGAVRAAGSQGAGPIEYSEDRSAEWVQCKGKYLYFSLTDLISLTSALFRELEVIPGGIFT